MKTWPLNVVLSKAEGCGTNVFRRTDIQLCWSYLFPVYEYKNDHSGCSPTGKDSVAIF